MGNINNKKHYTGGKQNILNDPPVIKLLSKYTEELRKGQIDPEEFIKGYHYYGCAKQEIIREMRFAAVLERIYATEGRKNTHMFTRDQSRKTTAMVIKAVVNKLRTMKKGHNL